MHPALVVVHERVTHERDVAKAAKQVRPAPVVVICTGYASPVNTRSALQMHVDYFANKPVDLDELISNLDRLLARRGEIHSGRGKR